MLREMKKKEKDKKKSLTPPPPPPSDRRWREGEIPAKPKDYRG